MAKPISRSLLEQMDTEQLDELLREYTQSPEDGSEDLCFMILDIIEQREKQASTGRLPDTDRGWQDFQTYYLASEETLYPLENDIYPQADTVNKKAKVVRLSRILIAAALLTILVTFLIPSAFGYPSIIHLIGKWGNDTFQFVWEESSNTANTSNQTADALDLAYSLRPTWIPEGYTCISDAEYFRNDLCQKVYYRYTNQQGDLLKIIISIYDTPEDIQTLIVEKNEHPVEIYTSNGRDFYIFGNGLLEDTVEDTNTALYLESTTLITIGGNYVSRDELKLIIDSIGGRCH